MTVEINDVCVSSFLEFSTVSEDDVHKVIKESAIKSSDLDPLPASLFKECKEELLPAITDIINCSLMTGVVPKELKISRIIPLLNKAVLEPCVSPAFAITFFCIHCNILDLKIHQSMWIH